MKVAQLDSWGDEMFTQLRPLELRCFNDSENSLHVKDTFITTAPKRKEMSSNIVQLSWHAETLNSIMDDSSEREDISETNSIPSPESPYGSAYESSASSSNFSSPQRDDNWHVSTIYPTQDRNVKLSSEVLPPTCLPQSSQPSQLHSDLSNLTKRVKLVPVKRNIKNTKRENLLQKADSAKPIYIQSVNMKDESQNTIILSAQDGTTFAHSVNSQHQQLQTPEVQSLPVGDINIHCPFGDSGISADSLCQLPQTVEVINTTPNVSSESFTNSLVNAPVIIKNEPIECSDIIIKAESINCAPYIIKREMNCTTIMANNETGDGGFPLKNAADDELARALKRQQRMIKNRESAHLSRKKKKEYVRSLEKQLSDLKEENTNLKVENTILKQKITEIQGDVKEIIGHNKDSSFKLSKMKTVVAFCALLLTVSVNFNSFGGIFLRDVNYKTTLDKAPTPALNVEPIIHSRTLLWAVNENDDNIRDRLEDSFNKNIPMYQPICPNINQSESIRLDSELRRWIDGESDRDNRTTLIETMLKSDSLHEILSPRPPLVGNTRRKLYLSQDKKIKSAHKTINVPPAASSNAVQVFSPILSEHASLFEALGRRDDTFYVVWFTGEHLLLPAFRTNDTARPKMSLVLPAVSINSTFSTPPKHITMMQIDCEVTNTQLLHLQQSVIPVNLRNVKSTDRSNRSNSVQNVANSSTSNLRNTRNYKPYFIKEANQKDVYRKNYKEIYDDKNVRDFRDKNTIYV